jgi:hypothetical protein
MRLPEWSDMRLLDGLDALVASHRQCTADIVAHLAELDSRSAVIARGYASLFQYCRDHLRFSEDEACRRIEAARMAQRFPAILALLAAGSVTLSSLALLKHHITLEKQKLGATTKPRAPATPSHPGAKTTPGSPHIPSAVRRAIVAKEGLRCPFVGIDGRRCECRAFLEFDHVTSKGLGGSNAENNARLLCRAHNQYAAERIYGAATVRRFRTSHPRHRS